MVDSMFISVVGWTNCKLQLVFTTIVLFFLSRYQLSDVWKWWFAIKIKHASKENIMIKSCATQVPDNSRKYDVSNCGNYYRLRYTRIVHAFASIRSIISIALYPNLALRLNYPSTTSGHWTLLSSEVAIFRHQWSKLVMIIYTWPVFLISSPSCRLLIRLGFVLGPWRLETSVTVIGRPPGVSLNQPQHLGWHSGLFH